MPPATGASIQVPDHRAAAGHAIARSAAPRVDLMWATTLGLAAALSFSIQPLYARLLLPRLGGAPAVWVVALLFFQATLLLGYAYAHLLARSRSLKVQVVIHACLLLASAAWLPPALRAIPDGTAPALATLLALATGVGVPYAVLTATSPLLQHWLARSRSSADPYVLYAASNGGSLAGLLAYPFLLEPLLGLNAQTWLWASGYVVCALAIAACGLLAVQMSARTRGETLSVATRPGERITLARFARWVGLAALPSAWLGAVTTHVTTAVAPLPLLWVVPLAAYLVTLILAFAPTDAARVRLPLATSGDLATLLATLRARRMLLARLAVGISALLVATHTSDPAPLVVLLHVLGLFAGALVCHTRLAADRPTPSALTTFYLALALGGALGGAFAAVVAPSLFRSLLEYPLVLALFWASGLVRPPGSPGIRAGVGLAAAAGLVVLVAAGGVHWFLIPVLSGLAVLLAFAAARTPLAAGVVLLAALLVADANPILGGYQQQFVGRSFFGVNRVLLSPDRTQRILLNGLISHGQQSLDPARATETEGYYTREGPLGDLLRPGGDERVGVVGLGAGTLACYGGGGREVSFFEIDPSVIALAADPDLFSYLALCPPREVVAGDGRLSLQRVPDGAYDMLVVDAYSGDTMPLHLLTREALGLYRRVLAPDGALVLHVSNRYFDLEPLVAALADDAGLAARIREDGIDESAAEPAKHPVGWSPSVWTIVGSDESVQGRLAGATGWRPLRHRADVGVWTDDYANPLAVRR